MHRSSSGLATGAHADDLDRLAFDRKADACGGIDHGIADGRVLQLDRRMAQAADQELALMRVSGVIAAREGVERGNPMHQSVFQEEIQRTVNRWRGRTAAVFITQHREDVVGTQRFVALPDQFQHATAQGGQAQTLFGAQRIGFGKGRMYAVRVVMGRLARGVLGMSSDDIG